MKESNTVQAASMPFDPLSWETYSRATRKQVVLDALQSGNVDVLVSLTHHNLLMFGKGGNATSEHTIRAYRTGVRQFLAYALPLGWERMTEHDTDLTVGYLRSLERQGLQPGTVNSRRTAARALYRALRWAGVLLADPFADTPRAQDPVPKWDRRDAYSREDVERLLAAADPDLRVALLLAAHGALRISEVVGLKWEHVNLQEGSMRITGKGRKTAGVYLTPTLKAALAAEVPADEYVCAYRSPKTLRGHLIALCKRLGIRYERRQFHGLRHAAATMLLADTGDLFTVARHLRHSSVSSTEIYAKHNADKLTEALHNWGRKAG